jgi:hypothetical protein
MPVYVYRRSDGSTFETFQSIKDEALTLCPETGLDVRRVICTPQVLWGDKIGIPEHEKMARKERGMKELQKDPLYTNLPEYKEKVEKFRDEMNEIVENSPYRQPIKKQ